MKKIILFLTITLLFITGCGNTSNATSIDIESASKELDSKYTNMAVIDDNQLNVIYGLDTTLLDEYVIKSSSKSNGDFYAIIKTNNDNRKDVENQMNKMFTIMEEQSNLYSQEAVNKIKNRLETTIGDNLVYIISDNNEEMYNILKGYIS